MGRRTPAGELVARRIRARIGSEPPPEAGEPQPEPTLEEGWPPESLLELHDRYDVSHVDVTVRRPVLGRLATPLRRMLLRPVLDLAGRQAEVNALTARVLSELANRTVQLQVSEASRLAQEQAIRALRRRVAALESELRDVRALAAGQRDVR